MDMTCGIDIIEIDRIKESIDTLEERFLNRIFTQNEIKYCESKNAQKYQHYAVRFSAKEAVLKALTKYLDDKFSVEWKDIEVVNDETGRPSVVINNKIIEKIDMIDVSLSHCKQYAVANSVVIWKLID